MESTMKRTHPLSFPIKMVWVAIAMIATFHLAMSMFTKHFMVIIDGNDASDRCIPEFSVYLLKRDFEQIEVGKIYTFKASGMTPFFADGTLITKYAAAASGDQIVQNEQGVFINDQQIIDGYPLSEKIGVPSSSFFKSYQVNQDEVFFTAPSSKSFDSRYWGTVEVNNIVGEAIPLW
ncbi:hypothetical protein VA249_45640 (plasmid) [Vibrio alfacsensis]|nr:hypothetical protein VA249_45640 [Vibrio alfacsensis]